METLPLRNLKNHLFIEIESALWLLDTGSPKSFGQETAIVLDNEKAHIDRSLAGLNAESITRQVGVPCRGLLGGDVLGRFDFIFDVPGEKVIISTNELSLRGVSVDLHDFMRLPILSIRVLGSGYRMFFDTGAQISFLPEETAASFPSAGRYKDFHPSIGDFETETYDVEVSLGGIVFNIRTGVLPKLLGTTLLMAGTSGIIGNQVLRRRSVGYFPRRGKLIL